MALFSLVIFKSAWWACALSGPSSLPLLGPAVVLLQLLLWLSRVENKKEELGLLLLLTGIGIISDNTLLYFEALSVPVHFFVPAPFSPLWLIALWVSFAIAIRDSLQFLAHRYLIAAFIGLIGGPFAYKGGAALGALYVSKVGIFALAGAWCIVFPLLIYLSDRSPPKTKSQEPS